MNTYFLYDECNDFKCMRNELFTAGQLTHYATIVSILLMKLGNMEIEKRDHEKLDFCDISCTTLLCLLNSFDELGNMK